MEGDSGPPPRRRPSFAMVALAVAVACGVLEFFLLMANASCGWTGAFAFLSVVSVAASITAVVAALVRLAGGGAEARGEIVPALVVGVMFSLWSLVVLFAVGFCTAA